MSRKRRKKDEEEMTYWLSYSDMMAALLLMFVLIISVTMLQVRKQYEKSISQEAIMKEQQEKIDRIVGIRTDLIGELKLEFEGTNLGVSVDEQTGAIAFDSNVLFDYNKYALKPSGKKFLKEFIPRYFNIILDDDFKDYVSEIIIEGHTDTNGEYLFNLELSQKRALTVAKYCLGDSVDISAEELELLRNIVTANGRSYSNPVYMSDGKTVNDEASRRVEFKFRLKDEDMINEMMTILNADK